MSKVNGSQDPHDMTCRDLKDADTKFNDARRKADDAQDQVEVHKERCRRLSAVGPPKKT